MSRLSFLYSSNILFELNLSLSLAVVDYKFGEAKPGYEAEEERFRFSQQQEDRPAEEITSLTHLAKWKLDGFKPVFLLDVKRGRVAACAVSDAGESSFSPRLPSRLSDLRSSVVLSRIPRRLLRSEESLRVRPPRT